jgi:pimeloyl-ACP methyl ester carboxylesterase
LADHLGLEDFSICAWSGGGPFGLACAYALPERVNSLVLASSVAPLKNGKLLDEMLLTNRLLLRVARDAPFLLGAPITLMGYLLSWAPEHRLDGLSEQLCPRDQELLKRDSLREIMLADMDEAIRQGYEAGQQELNLIAQPWGFSLEEIHTPATVIHGQEDAIIPPAMGRSLAAKLPHSTLIEREEEGHFLLFEHWRAVVRMALGQAKNRVLIGH